MKDVININVKVNKDVWKKLKVISVDKEIDFHDLVRNILEKAVSNKKLDTIVPDIN